MAYHSACPFRRGSIIPLPEQKYTSRPGAGTKNRQDSAPGRCITIRFNNLQREAPNRQLQGFCHMLAIIGPFWLDILP